MGNVRDRNIRGVAHGGDDGAYSLSTQQYLRRLLDVFHTMLNLTVSWTLTIMSESRSLVSGAVDNPLSDT